MIRYFLQRAIVAAVFVLVVSSAAALPAIDPDAGSMRNSSRLYWAAGTSAAPTRCGPG
jgi:hypothetical protein